MKNDEDFTQCINKSLKGTKTEKNLQEAFCGESKARNKYTFFAKQAKADGYEHISKIFEETAENEAQHAKIWFKLLNGGTMPTTLDNLKSAACTESYEWEQMYAEFTQDAREEGFDKIAALFDTIRSIEKMHMKRYEKLVQDIEENAVFCKTRNVLWECSKCGYQCQSTNAPEQCAFCRHPQAYFFERNC